jgi:predicted RNA polymerase sigma factor
VGRGTGRLRAHAGIDELDAIPKRDLLARYPYALAAYAELHASLGQVERARAYLDRALALQSSPAERALLLPKRAALGAGPVDGQTRIKSPNQLG